MKSFLVIATLVSSFTFSFGQNNPTEISDKFFHIYKKEGVDQALTYLFSTNKFSVEIQENLDELKQNLVKATNDVGEFEGTDLLAKKAAGPNLVMLTYLVRYEKLPFTFRILLYNPNGKWQVQNFKFNNKIDEELEKVSMVSGN
ncbi:MAG: hypothetical protein ACTHMM_26915 [Agriterribacter sp.]